jgi:hypothetical protein
MRMMFALTLALLPTALCAQVEEDEAHRADRSQTERLNRNAAASVDRRLAANQKALNRYRDAQAAYQREREAWRRRVAACEGGDDRACDPG